MITDHDPPRGDGHGLPEKSRCGFPVHSSCRMLTMTDHSFAENQSELDCCHLKKLKKADVWYACRLVRRETSWRWSIRSLRPKWSK